MEKKMKILKQVMNHNKDNGLLNMIRRTDTMIFKIDIIFRICEFQKEPIVL